MAHRLEKGDRVKLRHKDVANYVDAILEKKDHAYGSESYVFIWRVNANEIGVVEAVDAGENFRISKGDKETEVIYAVSCGGRGRLTREIPVGLTKVTTHDEERYRQRFNRYDTSLKAAESNN